jgi:hypothetical protein
LSLLPQAFFGTPTGTTPRAKATSSLTHETVTTRRGCDLMVVSPKTFLMVTGNWPLAAGVVAELAVVEPVEQAVRDSATAATAAVAAPAVFSRARREGREATGLLR